MTDTELFVDGAKIDETLGRLGAGISWQAWKNGGELRRALSEPFLADTIAKLRVGDGRGRGCWRRFFYSVSKFIGPLPLYGLLSGSNYNGQQLF